MFRSEACYFQACGYSGQWPGKREWGGGEKKPSGLHRGFSSLCICFPSVIKNKETLVNWPVLGKKKGKMYSKSQGIPSSIIYI